jgi:TPR repeat protein
MALREPEEAIFWLRLAAEQGDLRSQFNLANIAGDYRVKAKKWLQKASEQGNEEAKRYLLWLKEVEEINEHFRH